MRELISNKDYTGIRQALSNNPALANDGIPFDEINITKAHPLHRICDGVFAGKYTDAEAVIMAKLFIEFGADMNGGALIELRDTPLIAAASLHADQTALLYIARGANIHHPGCHGGTAIHWAAWCGRPIVVKQLIDSGAAINTLCTDLKSTPLFWVVHGLKNASKSPLAHYTDCIKMLL
jgi:ankyrin repeat protein